MSRLLIAVAVGLFATLPLGPVGAAVAAPAENCAAVLGKAPAEDAASPVISTTCATGTPVVPAEVVRLARVFEHANYGGLYWDLYGAAGPCDAAGYNLTDLTAVNLNLRGISSYRVYSNCNYTSVCNGRAPGNYSCSNYRCWDVPWVGPQDNDRVYQMRLRNYRSCL